MTKDAVKMHKYECEICGYVYDPANGDPDGGVEADTPFDQLLSSWVCPVCGATRDNFKPVLE